MKLSYVANASIVVSAGVYAARAVPTRGALLFLFALLALNVFSATLWERRTRARDRGRG